MAEEERPRRKTAGKPALKLDPSASLAGQQLLGRHPVIRNETAASDPDTDGSGEDSEAKSLQVTPQWANQPRRSSDEPREQPKASAARSFPDSETLPERPASDKLSSLYPAIDARLVSPGREASPPSQRSGGAGEHPLLSDALYLDWGQASQDRALCEERVMGIIEAATTRTL
jgi:hypothetical protein